MKKLIGFFVDRPLLVNLITVFVCIFGLVSAWNTNRALIPPIAIKQIHINAILPGASAIDVERFVSFRIEEALHGLEGLDEITSNTGNSSAKVVLKFKPEYEDMTKALEQTRSMLDSIRHLFPQDMRPFVIEQPRVTKIGLIDISIKNANHSNPEHRQAVELIQERISRIPSVVEVKTSLKDIDLYIIFMSKKLEQHGINITTAQNRVLEYLSFMPLGQVRVVDQNIAVEMSKPFKKINDLKNLPLIVNRAGFGVILKQVANVEFRFKDELTRTKLNGKDFVSMEIFIDVEADAINMSSKIRDFLDNKTKDILPQGLEIELNTDGADIIDHELEILKVNGLGGLVLVFLILLVFLGWRVSIITTIGLPFCYLGTVIALSYFDVNFNLISLVAMILVIGILVDDAIIVAEEFTKFKIKGSSSRESAIDAVYTVSKPVVGMVATTIVAFVPLLLIKGESSNIVRALPIVLISTLLFSLFESFFILPNHLREIVPDSKKVPQRKFMVFFIKIYKAVLSINLKLRYIFVIVILAICILAVYLLSNKMKTNLTSISISTSAFVHAELESANSLDEIEKKIKPVEEIIEQLPKDLMLNYKTELGISRMTKHNLEGFKYAYITVAAKGKMAEADKNRFELQRILKEKIKEIKGFKKLNIVEWGKSKSEQRDVITVYVSGGDKIEFERIQNSIREAISSVKSVEDIFMDETRFQKVFKFEPNARKVLSYNLSTSEISAQLREHFSKEELLRIRYNGDEIDVFVEVDKVPVHTMTQFLNINVMTPRGIAVPLKFLGKWRESKILRRIEHKDMMRLFRVDVVYNKEKTDAKKVTEDIEKSLEPVRKSYPGYHVSVKYGESESKAKKWGIKIAVVCVGLIYLCLTLALGSLLQPILVVLVIPLSFFGVILALFAHGMELNIMAAIGVIGLAGVVVNDALVMLTTINSSIKATKENEVSNVKEGILTGAMSRFQAVILTSLTTLGGVFPLAYGLGGDAFWIQPMVFALGWGLLFATVINLFFLPCMLLIGNDIKSSFSFIKSLFKRKSKKEIIAE